MSGRHDALQKDRQPFESIQPLNRGALANPYHSGVAGSRRLA
jgi:hypothetical protein